MSVLHVLQGGNAVEVGLHLGVGRQVNADVLGPRQDNVQVRVNHSEGVTDNEVAVANEVIVQVGELLVHTSAEVGSDISGSVRHEEASNSRVHLSCDIRQGIQQQGALRSSGGRSDRARLLVSDPQLDSNVLVQHSAVLQDQSRNVALGVNGVEINTGGSDVGTDINLLRIQSDTSSERGDERGSTARSGSIVKLGHFCCGK